MLNAQIELLTEFGWKEYPINKTVDQNDKSFFKKIDGQQFEIRMWDFTKYRRDIPDGWDIVARLDGLQIEMNIELTIEDIDEKIDKILKMLSTLEVSV